MFCVFTSIAARFPMSQWNAVEEYVTLYPCIPWLMGCPARLPWPKQVVSCHIPEAHAEERREEDCFPSVWRAQYAWRPAQRALGYPTCMLRCLPHPHTLSKENVISNNNAYGYIHIYVHNYLRRIINTYTRILTPSPSCGIDNLIRSTGQFICDSIIYIFLLVLKCASFFCTAQASARPSSITTILVALAELSWSLGSGWRTHLCSNEHEEMLSISMEICTRTSIYALE